ncbi:MAG TPA: methyltransferase domain-containing protein [Thermoleophilaceae bacterium]|jgi:SAM-dependent methyltransferase
MTDIADIRRFWNEQAEAHGQDPQATTPDRWVREVEIASLSEQLAQLPAGATVLDIGCGNGYSVIRLAEQHPDVSFVGGDYAPAMIEQARRSLNDHPQLEGRVSFHEMDVLALPLDRVFDVVITDRCLINLPSFEDQRRAIARIARVVRPGGRYLAVENFHGGQDGLNRQREQLGLPPIAIRWHNCFLDERAFADACSEFFDVAPAAPITSTYYLITRCVYSKLCQMAGAEPGYDDPIYEVAAQLPPLGDFGPVKLVAMVRR